MNQLEIHKKIDEIVKNNPSDEVEEEVLEIVNTNFDARNYFFSQVDERWVEWLWGNGFLDILKKQPEDTTRYSYTTPEINYLVKVAPKKPDFAVDEIILNGGLATTKENFNPELVDRILRLCAELDAKYIVKIIPKIKEENWVKLMAPFGHWGFEYEKMFEALYKAGEFDAVIELAGVVLTVRSGDELSKDTFDKNPFYIRDFSYTKVFEYLEKIEGKRGEKVLGLLTSVIREIANLGEDAKDSVFAKEDIFYLWDVDFFKDEYTETEHRSYKDSVKDLMLFTAKVLKDLIKKECDKDDKGGVKKIFDDYIGGFDDEKAILPDTRMTWQLRLFVLSLCPEVFKDEIKKSLFRLFDDENEKINFEVKGGAEYERLLKKCFFVLSSEDQKRYKKRAEELFILECEGKTEEQQEYRKHSGARIFCLIGEKEKAMEVFGVNCDEIETEPSTSIKVGEAGFVVSQSPVPQEEFDKKTIDEIIELLQGEWTPKKLNEQNENQDFHRPQNAEGVGNLIENGVFNRFEKFIKNAEKFFDKDKIDAHYTYAFLRGVQEALKKGKRVGSDDWQGLVSLLKNLVDAGLKGGKREEGFYDTWLANWESVYRATADVLQGLLSEENKEIVIGDFGKYRDDFLHILEVLLNYEDPKPSDEVSETAKSKISDGGGGNMVISDPYSIAINSVKGRAFQAFLMFVYQDGKELKGEKVKIKDDVKSLYEEILSTENTRAMMFMHGHHLPTFYFRDASWTKDKLISFVFESSSADLALAGAEGYLSQSLYKEMFEDAHIRKLYEKWIDLKDTQYTNGQKHWKNIDEALAIHLALAFIHFGLDVDVGGGFKDDLLKKFWETENPNNKTRYHEFISFIGRSVLTKDQVSDEWLEKNDIDKEKFVRFWDWVLGNKKIKDPEIFSGFGFWINPEKEIIKDEILAVKLIKTLEKSKGRFDWDYGFIRRLPVLADIAPEETLKIIKAYLLDENNKLIDYKSRIPIHEEEYKSALEIIYNKSSSYKLRVIDLVNVLIEKGGSAFWNLKSIIKQNEK